MTTLGIEEEYLLLDPSSGLPMHCATDVQQLLASSPGLNDGDIQRELLSCQIETATPVCDTLTQAEESLLNFRRQLAAAARACGALAAPTATAPRIGQHYPELTDKQRYRDLQTSAPGIVGDQFVNGLHVHVGIPDKETGVQALNRIRPWLPIITALSTNSPYWLDRDSGFGSWRVIHYRRWAVQGIPPLFADAADYERRIARLEKTGAIIDRGVLTWVARLSDTYPTLEVRTGDAQLEAQDSVLLAALIRGLVTTAISAARAGAPLPDPDTELLDAALWQSARDGMTAHAVDPDTGTTMLARQRLSELLEFIGPALDAEGDTEWVETALTYLESRGTGSERQRRAMHNAGMRGLLTLYRDSLTNED